MTRRSTSNAGIGRGAKSATAIVTAIVTAATLVLLMTACMTPGGMTGSDASTLTSSRIAQIVASPDRGPADRSNDVRRKPEQMLAFIGLRPGLVALDISAGRGYTTDLLARAVGPGGKVYAQTQPRDPARAPAPPAAPEGNAAPGVAAPAAPSAAAPATAAVPSNVAAPVTLADRPRNPMTPNIVLVSRRFDEPVPPEVANAGLDVVTLMFNYHDFGHLGVDRASLNRAVFAALKSGGVYVIADHAGRPGTGISESGTLHRVEPDFVRREVEAAGFKLAGQGDFLRNPNDPRDKNTPEPAQPKDEFVMKFVKP